MITTENNSGEVHHLETPIQHLLGCQRIKTVRIGVQAWACTTDAAYLVRFERRIGANLKASQTGGSIGREEGMTR